VASGLYALNRWIVAPHIPHPFLSGHFNDLLLIPAALPWVLWLQKKLEWRGGGFPTWLEITGHWLVWSLASELLAPGIFPQTTADWKDVAAYAAGGLLSGILWNWK